MTYHTVEQCPCGDSICNDWHVAPVADLQGVKFSHDQAVAVAKLLNEMEESKQTSLGRKNKDPSQ